MAEKKKVTSIFGPERITAADCRSIADDLEELVSKIRSGELKAVRGLLIMYMSDTTIDHEAVGDPLSKLECVGLCSWTVEDIKNG